MAITAAMPKPTTRPRLISWAVVVCSSTSAWYSSGNVGVREAIFDVGGHGVEAAAADVGFDVDVALGGVAPDDGRRGLDAHVGHLFQSYVTAARRVDQQVAHALHALAHVGHALHDDLEHLLLAEDVADHDTLQQHGRRPADVARLDTIRFRSCEVRLDREDRLFWHGLDTRVEDAVDRAHDVSHVVRLAAQSVEVLTVDAHHEGLVRARKDIEVVAGTRRFGVNERPDVVNLLLRIGHDLAVDRFVDAGHDVLDLCYRRVIVGV